LRAFSKAGYVVKHAAGSTWQTERVALDGTRRSLASIDGTCDWARAIPSPDGTSRSNVICATSLKRGPSLAIYVRRTPSLRGEEFILVHGRIMSKARRGRIGAPVTRATSWWLRTLRERARTMYDGHRALEPVEFASEEERQACIAFFTAALTAEQSGSTQAQRLADEMRPLDPELAECLQLYGAEENWHRELLVEFLQHLGTEVKPVGGMTGLFHRTYGRARDLPTIMLTNLMFEVIGSTTYRIALGRVTQPAVRCMLTILARDESFHVPLNVHFIRESRRLRGTTAGERLWLTGVYHVVFWALIASAAASRRIAKPFDHIGFGELARAYAENLGRLFLQEHDLRFRPPELALRMFGLRGKELAESENVLSASAAEAAARREQVQVAPLEREQRA
jgi:hypothetical protein